MMKISKNLIAAVFSLAILLFSTASAQNLRHILPSLDKFNRPTGNPNSVNSSPAADLETNFDNLTIKARENGTVRIIVGFRVDNYRPDAELDDSQQTRQRGDIKQKQAVLLNRLRDLDVKNVRQFDYIPFMAMEVTADALAALRESPDITSIQENQMQSASLVQSIPILGGSPFGGATGGTFSGFSGAGRTIAVLDTGVDKAHPFFNNRVVSEACYSKNTATTASVCPGGASSSTASGSGVHCTVAGCDHGTHVAGIAAGGNPLVSGNGVARDANIIAVQVFSRLTNCQSTTDCTTAFTDDTIAGLERVYALRTTFQIDAVNLSLGGGRYFNYCDTEQAGYKTIIDNLRSAGIATIIASGNSSYTDSVGAPSCISTGFSIGSTNDGDVFPIDFVSTFSNSYSLLNLLAPGELIISAVPGGFYDNKQGTSMAAPMVAGAWAVMKQRYPTETIPQILTRFRYGGVQVLDTRHGLVKPRINITSAMNTSNVDPCGTASPINFGQTINGSLSNTDCLLLIGSRADIYSFSGTAGQGVAISLGSPTYFNYLYLVNSSGNIVGQNGNGNNSRIPASGFLNLPATGTYYIYATSVEGNRFGNYSLNLTTNSSCNFTITSSSQNFAAGGGNGSFGVNTTAGCAWTAQSNAAWLTTSSTGNGNGTVNYTVAPNTSGSQRIGTITAGGQVHTVTQAAASVVTARAPFDFDGDNKTDLSIYRPSLGQWWLLRSSNGSNFAAAFGGSTDRIAAADFTGDQKADIAIFRPSTGQWFVLRSEDSSFFAFPFGANGDTPVPADYDGDGKADAAVFRPSNATWFIQKSTGGTDILGFGNSTDKPVPADYDGDGKADIAIFRANGANGAEWWIRRSSNGSVFATIFGNSTDKPTQGDFTGDGKADIALFRPSNGNWFVLRSEDFSFFSFPFGANGDAPVAGDYDGDGRFDAGVFRPSNSTWFVQRSTAGTLIQAFGTTGDQPIPNVFVP